MFNFAGLGAVYPGYQQAQQTELRNRGLESDLLNADLDRQGAAALGRTFQAMMPGAQPMPQAPTPAPGQASMPQAPTPAGPAIEPMPAMQQGPSPAPLQTGGATPSGMQPGTEFQGFDLQTAWGAVARANPGARPEVVVSALSKAMPYLNAQAQQQVAQMSARLRGQEFGLREKQFDETQRHNLATEEIARARPVAGGKGGSVVQRFIDDYQQANPGATMDEALRAYQKARTPAGQLAKDEAQVVARENLTSQIDSAIRLLENSQQGGPQVAGMPGMANRWKEGIGGWLGWTNQTDANDFETAVRAIQNQYPRFVQGTARISKDEREQINTVVRGLGRIDNPQTTLSSLKYVRDIINRTVDSGKLKNGEKSAPSEGDSKPLTPEIRKAAEGAMKRNGWTRQQVIDTLREQGYDTGGF